MHYLLTLLSQIAALAAVAYVYVGDQWLADNYGLHPMIAGAAALSLLALPYAMAYAMHNKGTYGLCPLCKQDREDTRAMVHGYIHAIKTDNKHNDPIKRDEHLQQLGEEIDLLTKE